MNSETINNSLELKWGTQTPISYKDPTFDMLNFAVKGKCIYNLVNQQEDKTKMEEFLFQNIQSVLPKITSYPIVSNYNDFQVKSVELSQMLENDLKTMVSSNITIESLKIEFIEFLRRIHRKTGDIRRLVFFRRGNYRFGEGRQRFHQIDFF